MDSTSSDEGLTFLFRGKNVPVTYPSMSREVALLALESNPFQTWSKRCEQEDGQKRIEIHSGRDSKCRSFWRQVSIEEKE
jgi:hypothetical protein